MNKIFRTTNANATSDICAHARHAFRSVLAVCALAACGLVSSAAGQEPSTTYRGTSRDPFAKYKPVVRRAPIKKATAVAVAKPTPALPSLVVTPQLQARIDQYKSLKVAAMNAQQPAPKPVTALVLDEVQITGIFRTPRGYAAMIEATPIKLSYVIYPGERFYDGQLVAVEENRLVFRREKRFTNGKTESVVETKPLRTGNAVTNEMVQTKSAQPVTNGANDSSIAADAQTPNANPNPR
jgi:hypothetical protein